MPRCFPLAVALTCLPAAGTVLLDFEDEADAARFHDENGTANRAFPVNREGRYATSGEYALCFRTPKWQPGMGEWPAVELTPPLTDWSAYDRLAWDLTNPTAAPLKLFVFIAGEGQATRRGYLYRAELPPYSYHGAELPLSAVRAQGVDLTKVRVMHWFTERPAGDLELYLDRVLLLAPGEPRPQPPAGYLAQFAALQVDGVAALRAQLAGARARQEALTAGLPAVAGWARRRLAEATARVEAFAQLVADGSPVILEAQALQQDLEGALARLDELLALRVAFERQRAAVAAGPRARNDLVVGFATSMEKIRPRSAPLPLTIAPGTSLALARGEREAFQVVVLPCERPVSAAQVRVSDLAGPGGAIFPAGAIHAAPVGYVETKTIPPYGSEQVGWWPDPILDYLASADIETGDAQAFWVRLTAPRDQPPGLYRGRIELLEAGRPLYRFALEVEVYPFTLPRRSPLDMAVTWWPMYYEPNEAGGWREGVYRDPIWRRHKLAWADFLADYYLTYDSLYSFADWAPDFEVLTYLHEQGRLGRFNLGYYSAMPEATDQQEAWKADVLKRIGEPYQRAKELGLLDHAYIYGCDEHPEELFPAVERAAAFLKQAFPGVTILTTTYDHSFGTNSPLQSMDAFCPLTPSYRRELADRVRAAGKQVWWYICCGPGHPFCNMFIEFPAIEGRLLMGAQTAKYRPDGFLYYQTSIWNSGPISRGPFTDWEPRSWTTYHGDGSWTCLGPDGIPVATIRLENFRDGVEDYAYALLLEAAIRQVEASPGAASKAAWLAAAREALEVPETVAKGMTEYSHDAAELYRWRAAMAAALKSSGLPSESLLLPER